VIGSTGAIVAVAAGLGLAVTAAAASYRVWRHQTRGVTEELKQVLFGLKDAFASITEHRQQLEAMKRDLAALEILESD